MQTKQDGVEASLRVQKVKVSSYRPHTSDVLPLTTQQLTDTQTSEITHHYRLQQSAYVNHRDIPPLLNGPRGLQYYPGILNDLTHHHNHVGGSHVLMNGALNDKKAFDASLPRIVITGSDERGFPDYHPIGNAHTAKNSNSNERAAREHHSVLGVPPAHSAIVSKEKVQKEKLVHAHASTNKRNKQRIYDTPNELAMKLSLPCQSGCCYCVYASLLGPVKVFVSRVDPPKKGPFLGKIKDGNGRPVIPVARKSDLRGLVYDPKSHSLYPPISKGERPLFQETRGSQKIKAPQIGTKRDVSSKRKPATKYSKNVFHKH